MQAKGFPLNLPPIWTSPRSFPGGSIPSVRNLQAGNAFLDLVRTRQYTRSRVSRALPSHSSGYPSGDGTCFRPHDLRVLGFRREASDLLSEIKKKSRLPLVTKAAGHPELSGRNPDLFSLSSRKLLQRAFQTSYHSLVLEAVDRSGDPSSSVHKVLTVEAVDRHDRSVAQKAAKLYIVSHFLSDNRNQSGQPLSSGLPYQCAISSAITPAMEAAEVSPGTAIISRPTEQTQVIASSFSIVRAPCCHRIDHSLILTDRNECAAQTAHIGGSHNAALFHLIVEKCQGSRGSRRARTLQTDLLKNLRNAVTHSRCRSQGKIDNTKRNAQTAGWLPELPAVPHG